MLSNDISLMFWGKLCNLYLWWINSFKGKLFLVADILRVNLLIQFSNGINYSKFCFWNSKYSHAHITLEYQILFYKRVYKFCTNIGWYLCMSKHQHLRCVTQWKSHPLKSCFFLNRKSFLITILHTLGSWALILCERVCVCVWTCMHDYLYHFYNTGCYQSVNTGCKAI